jgi:hypothetical protein
MLVKRAAYDPEELDLVRGPFSSGALLTLNRFTETLKIEAAADRILRYRARRLQVFGSR